MKTITEQFIEKIIHETKSNNLIWNTLFTFTDAYDIQDLSGYKYVLYFDETHEFDYADSYICYNEDFCLIVLKEIFINAENNSTANEYNIYLSKDLTTYPDNLTVSNDLLEELLLSISKNIEIYKSGLNVDSIEIMKTYLHDHEPHEKSF